MSAMNPAYRACRKREEESSAELATNRRSESGLRARTKGSGNKAEQSDRWEREQLEGRKEDGGVGRAGSGGYKRQPVKGKTIYKLGMMLKRKERTGKGC